MCVCSSNYDGAVIMFDCTARMSYKQVPALHRDYVRINDSTPIVLVATKRESPDRKVKAKMVLFHRRKNLQYYELSSATGEYIGLPLVYLLRKFTS